MDARLYDELWTTEQRHWWFQARRHIVWSLAERYLGTGVRGLETEEESPTPSPQSPAPSPRLRICELGCGTGGNLAAVADRHDVVGIECSPLAIEYARRRLGDRVQRGTLPGEIPLSGEFFDVVLLTDVLEHIEDDFASAQAALHLVRPGGLVIATVPAYQWLYSPRDAHHHHFRRYSKRGFRALWPACDGRILLLSHYNTFLFPPAAVARLATKLLPRRDAAGDLAIPPAALNFLLARVMQSEANLLGRVPLPFGLSLVAVVRKRAASGFRKHDAA
jgi:SAM-dependent methyltransferase